MERVTISMSDEFAAEIGAFMKGYSYDNRSEAVRDLARLGLKGAQIDHGMAGDYGRRRMRREAPFFNSRRPPAPRRISACAGLSNGLDNPADVEPRGVQSIAPQSFQFKARIRMARFQAVACRSKHCMTS